MILVACLLASGSVLAKPKFNWFYVGDFVGMSKRYIDPILIQKLDGQEAEEYKEVEFWSKLVLTKTTTIEYEGLKITTYGGEYQISKEQVRCTSFLLCSIKTIYYSKQGVDKRLNGQRKKDWTENWGRTGINEDMAKAVCAIA